MVEFRPRSALVTGGAGFIGSNFVRHWLGSDPEVRIVDLDLLTYAGSMANLEALPAPGRHVFVQGDIADEALVARLLAQHNIDTIVHFAAESHVDRSIARPNEFIHTNVVGTFTLLESARQAWFAQGPRSDVRFHHISTDEVYGSLRRDDPPFLETTPYSPNSPYAASKAGADHLARSYHRTYGLPVSITHCSNNYGPYQHGEKFIPTVIRGCIGGTQIPVYGDGSNIRDWLHVEDHCRGIDAVLRRGRVGERYNICGGTQHSNLEIARMICRIMDELLPAGSPHERLIAFVADRPGHDWRYASDYRKIQTELGWDPRYRFEEGLRETAAWYLRRAAIGATHAG